MKNIRRMSLDSKVTGAFFHVDREIRHLERGLRAATREDRRANIVLRRAMEKRAAVEADRVRAKREEARKSAKAKARARAAAARVRAATAKKKEESVALQKRLDDLPKTFAAADFSKAGAAGLRARADSLERIQLRAPKLPFAARARWREVRDGFAKHYRVYKGFKTDAQIGPSWVNLLDKLLAALQEHYKGESPYNKPGASGGDKEAFYKLFVSMDKDCRNRQLR